MTDYAEVLAEYERLVAASRSPVDCAFHHNQGCSCAPAMKASRERDALIARHFEPLLRRAAGVE